ncbi:MAG: citrate lyase acyl carrier protein [Muribaculaceae bacterium]|nr:citrate lyase acyl carrier protein [Muribaculaceae bacterium]
MQLKESFAGTLESGDIHIRLLPSDKPGLTINLESSVAYQFGDQIRRVITESLTDFGIDSAEVNATDKGALDCTIRARVTAAAVRATGKDVWAD